VSADRRTSDGPETPICGATCVRSEMRCKGVSFDKKKEKWKRQSGLCADSGTKKWVLSKIEVLNY